MGIEQKNPRRTFLKMGTLEGPDLGATPRVAPSQYGMHAKPKGHAGKMFSGPPNDDCCVNSRPSAG